MVMKTNRIFSIASGAVMLILGAQMITSYLIEVFGLFGTEKVAFDWKKLIAVGLILAGIVVFQMTGKKVE